METKRKYDIRNSSVILFFITTFIVTGCGQNRSSRVIACNDL
jgi:hypothetical protein